MLLHILNINPSRPLLLLSDFRPMGQPTPAPPPHPSTSALSPHGIIRSPRRSPYPSQNTKNNSSCTGSSAQLSVACLRRLHLPTPHPSLSDSVSSSHSFPLSCLPNSCLHCSLAATEISSNIAFICLLAATYLHHGSWCVPSPS